MHDCKVVMVYKVIPEYEGIFSTGLNTGRYYKSVKILSECKVPELYMIWLRHPSKPGDIIQSFELCTKLYKPFELQPMG